MPAPLTTTLLALAFLLALIGVPIVAVIAGGVAVLNQVLVEIAMARSTEGEF